MNLSRIPSSFNAHQFPWCGAMPPLSVLRKASVGRSAALLAEARATDAAYAIKLAQRSERRLAKAHTLQVEGALPCVSGELPPLGTTTGRGHANAEANRLMPEGRGITLDGRVSYDDNDQRRDRAAVRVAGDILKREGSTEVLSRQWAVYGILPKIAHAVARTILEGFGLTVDAAGLKTLMRLVNPCTSRSGGRPRKVRIYTLLGPLSLPLGHSHPYTSDALPAPHVPSQAPLTPKGQTHGRGFGRGSHPLWGPSA